MTREETVLLTRYVRACCPHQAIDEYTPDAWHDILGHLDLAACRAAVVVIKQRAQFVDPCDIIAEVRHMSRPASNREHLRELLDPAAYRAQVDAADSAFLRKLAKRTGRALELKTAE